MIYPYFFFFGLAAILLIAAAVLHFGWLRRSEPVIREPDHFLIKVTPVYSKVKTGARTRRVLTGCRVSLVSEEPNFSSKKFNFPSERS